MTTTELLHGEIEKSGAQGGVDYEENGEESAGPVRVEHRVRPWGPSFYHGHHIAVILKAVTVVAARVVLVVVMEVVMVHSCRSRRFEPRRPVGHGVFFWHCGGENSSQTFATEKKWLRLEMTGLLLFWPHARARKYGTKEP